MKTPIILKNKLLLCGKNIIGITLYPFIIFRKSLIDNVSKERYDVILNHEKIHIEQQKELLVIPFYLWYCGEFLIKLLKYKDKAYYNLSFEREAYANEKDVNYIKSRKFFSFLKYL